MHLLTDIPFEIEPQTLLRRLRIRQESPDRSAFLDLLAEARGLGKPKALYLPLFLEERKEEAVKAGGHWFHSRVLSVNLRGVHRLFLYLATCGHELDAWAQKKKARLKTYFWAEAVKETALQQAIQALNDHIEETYHPGRLAHQNPGSLTDFPLSEQKVLFRLLADGPAAIGVKLLPSLVMTPSHSVSGIIFPTAEAFQSCLLCPREKCPGRRAPYDPTLYARKYARS